MSLVCIACVRIIMSIINEDPAIIQTGGCWYNVFSINAAYHTQLKTGVLRPSMFRECLWLPSFCINNGFIIICYVSIDKHICQHYHVYRISPIFSFQIFRERYLLKDITWVRLDSNKCAKFWSCHRPDVGWLVSFTDIFQCNLTCVAQGCFFASEVTLTNLGELSTILV